MPHPAPFAVVLLAHNDPEMVVRTIGAVRSADVFLHCDARTGLDVQQAMVPKHGSNVRLVPRRATKRSSWSLVAAELSGLRAALSHSQAEHIVIASGSCYPLMSYEAIADYLADARGQSILDLIEIPNPGWNRRWSNDGGMWRFTTRCLTLEDSLVTIRNMPVPLWRRSVPASITPYGSMQWKIYARSHAQALLGVFDADAAELSFWRTAFAPEETCVASILKSEAIIGDVAHAVIDRPAWFMRWPETGSTSHPDWLGIADYGSLREAKELRGACFARKIGSRENELLSTIDAELRGQ